MRRIALKFLACAIFLPLPALALLTRADRGDDEYVELATRYPSALSLGPGQGEAVLLTTGVRPQLSSSEITTR